MPDTAGQSRGAKQGNGIGNMLRSILRLCTSTQWMQEAYFFVSRSLTMLQAATPLASKAPGSVLPLNIGPCLVHLQ